MWGVGGRELGVGNPRSPHLLYETLVTLCMLDYNSSFTWSKCITIHIDFGNCVTSSVYRYLDLGGSEERGMRALAASYVGLPNMVNAMIELLHAAGYRKREIQGMVEEHLKSLVLRHFDPKKADLIFTEEGSVSCGLVYGCFSSQSLPIHLSLSPSLCLSLLPFLQTPSWLEEMIQYSTWRELFYQLADQYPDCLMLKFTIKLISDAGYQSEITSASTAAHQPEVFSGLVRNALSQISASPLTEIKRHLKEFTHLVCVSQQTYFYSQVRMYYVRKSSLRRFISNQSLIVG